MKKIIDGLISISGYKSFSKGIISAAKKEIEHSSDKIDSNKAEAAEDKKRFKFKNLKLTDEEISNRILVLKIYQLVMLFFVAYSVLSIISSGTVHSFIYSIAFFIMALTIFIRNSLLLYCFENRKVLGIKEYISVIKNKYLKYGAVK